MSKTANFKHRDSIVDIAKGIGIFLVVLGHVPLPRELLTAIYLFHMPLFFFLSGMFFHSEENFIYGVYKKVRTLIIPYFFFAFIGNSTNVLRDYIVYQTISIDSFWMLFDGSTAPLWFLICLFLCYLMSRLVSLISNNWKFLLFFSVIEGGIGFVLINKNVILPFWGVQALLMQFYYIVGYVVRTVAYKENTLYERFLKVDSLIIWVMLIAFFLCYLRFDIRPDVVSLELPYPFFFCIGSLLGIFLCIKLCKKISSKRSRLSMVLQQMGNQSLFILGFHSFLIYHLYFFSIPALMRVYSFFSIEVEGIYFRNCSWLGILFVIPSIYVSMVLGNYCMKYVKFLFRL